MRVDWRNYLEVGSESKNPEETQGFVASLPDTHNLHYVFYIILHNMIRCYPSLTLLRGSRVHIRAN